MTASPSPATISAIALTPINSCDPDETTMPQGVEALGEDKVIFASDYPHWDAVFPGAVKEVRERTGLSESAKRNILGENAARLYGLM